jgi:hypothetical protein
LYPKEFCGLEKLGPLTLALGALVMDAGTSIRVVGRLERPIKNAKIVWHLCKTGKNVVDSLP